MAVQINGLALPRVRAYVSFVQEEALSGFEDLHEKSDRIAEDQYTYLVSRSSVGGGDQADAAEMAFDKGLDFFNIMAELRQASLNIYSAGLFHLLEHQLDFLCHDAGFGGPPSKASLSRAVSWFGKNLELDLRKLNAWDTIDELRLLANTIKHGRGRSAQGLEKRRPNLFVDPLISQIGGPLGEAHTELFPLMGRGLYVRDADFKFYGAGAVRFLEGLRNTLDRSFDR
jgi:hypothetical protein